MPRAKPFKKDRQKYKLFQNSQRCGICREPITIKELYSHAVNLDHIIRKRDGGSNHISNVRITHSACNLQRD